MTLCTTLVTYLLVGFLTHVGELGTTISISDYALFPLDADCNAPLNFYDFLSFLLLGVLGGVAGHLFNLLVMQVLKLRLRFMNSRPGWRMFEIAVVAFCTVSVALFVPLSGAEECTPLSRTVSHITWQADRCVVRCESDFAQLIDQYNECYTDVCLADGQLAIYEQV
jgi:hypothetical protein